MALCVAALLGPVRVYPQGTEGNSSGPEAQLARAKELLPTDPDSARVLAMEAEKQVGRLPTAWQKVHAQMLIGDVYEATREMPEALTAYQRAQLMIDELPGKQDADTALILAKVDLQLKIGMLYFDLHDFEKSVVRFNAALGMLDAAHDALSQHQLDSRKVQAFNNIAGGYIQRSDYATALPYFQQAVAMNRTLDNPRYAGALNNNIGICYMEMGRHDLADQYFLQALAVRKQTGDVRGQAQVLNNLGKNQALMGHFEAARGHFEQALALGRSVDSPGSMVISLESLSTVEDTLGEYRKALAAFREFKALNDTLYSADARTTIARLEDKFRRDKEKKVFELEAQRKDAENARQRVLNIALAAALVLLLLIAFLLFKVMRARVRNGELERKTLRLEGEKLESERTILQESLASKDRELTANALFLLKKNELIAHIVDRLLKAKSTFRQENQKIVQDIVHDLQASQDEHNWKEFEAHFTRVHSTFYQTLQERFPSLTPNERKLCAFLRLNMSTKDISAITQQSLNSITVARSRLRKKLQIDGEDVQLIDLLQSI
jgi:tetratricopeptide (TPR) repeat protein